MLRLGQVPIETDLSGFSRWLMTQQVEHRISEESGAQVIWIERPELADAVRQALDDYLRDPEIHRRVDDAARTAIEVHPFNPWHRYRPTPWRAPVTHGLLVVMVLVFLTAFTSLGDRVYEALLFAGPDISGAASVASPADRLLLWWPILSADPWRWLTPSLLHFSVIHLAFNALMLWFIGGQVEAREGVGRLLALFLLASLLGNGLQFYLSGPWFGGASGVVYAQLGYAWSANRQRPRYLYPPMLFRVAVIWMVIGFTPLPGLLFGVNMANAAHLGGLLAGLILAQWPPARRRASND